MSKNVTGVDSADRANRSRMRTSDEIPPDSEMTGKLKQENIENDSGLTEKRLDFIDAALKAAGIGTWIFEIGESTWYFNDEALNLFGFGTGTNKRSGEEFLACVHPEDRNGMELLLSDAAKAPREIATDFRICLTDGSVRYLSARARSDNDNNGIPIRLNGLVWDVTEHATLEMALQESIRKTNSIKEELQASLDQQHQLTKYIEKVRENERTAISRELHDDLGQALTAVKMDLGTIRHMVSNPEAAARITKVSQLVNDTIKTVQRLTSQLRPQIIDDLGLESAIEWYTREYEERSRINISLKIEPWIEIPPDASHIVFRIMQEALTNIARYSKASRAEISLMHREGNVCLTVADNGIGIKDEEINSKNSFGIISMRERVDSLGGKFSICRGKKGGTMLEVSFPLIKKATT